MVQTPPHNLDALRKRSTRSLFLTVALGTTALYAAFTAAPLVARDLTGSTSWSGVPGAAAVLGAGLGAGAISRLMVARGRRPGLVLGYGIAAVGAAITALSFEAGLFVPLLLGMLMIGIGHGASQLSRFIAADLQPPQRRASALAFIVWASTVGAAAGPALLQPTRSVAEALGLPGLAGGFVIALVTYIGATVLSALLLRPDPRELAYKDTLEEITSSSADTGSAWQLPRVRMALVIMLASQFSMVLIMTMTPLHIRSSGHDLTAIGIVMSSHFVGMFALAPVAGRAVDRFGAIPIAFGGLATLVVAAALALAAPVSSHLVLALSLFLLGLGWSFAFVAGSGLLAGGLDYETRVRMQGNVDTLQWSVGALASLSSGLLLDALSYNALCLIGASIVGLSAIAVARQRPRAVVAT